MKNNKHTFCCTYTTRLPHFSLLVCDQFHSISLYLIQFDSIVWDNNWWDWLPCQVATSASLQSIPWCIDFIAQAACKTVQNLHRESKIANCLASYLSFPQTRTLLHTDVDVNPPMPWDARMSGFVVLTIAFLKFNTCARNGDFMSKFHGAMRRKRKRKGREKQRKTKKKESKEESKVASKEEAEPSEVWSSAPTSFALAQNFKTLWYSQMRKDLAAEQGW